MAKVIELRKPYEEYTIGHYSFKLDISDENMERLSKLLEPFLLNINHCTNYEQLSGMLKEFLNNIFNDENAGEQIYEVCGGSSNVVVDVISQLTEDLNKNKNNFTPNVSSFPKNTNKKNHKKRR